MRLSLLTQVGLESLMRAYENHLLLGASGKQKAARNEYGEQAVVADVVAERVVMNTFAEKELSVRTLSEEHRTQDVGLEPRHTLVIDGIDGTWKYIEQPPGRYATLVGIYAGLDPCYKDALFSGMVEHEAGCIVFAAKECGIVKIDVESNTVTSVQRSRPGPLSQSTRVRTDTKMDSSYNITAVHDSLGKYLRQCTVLEEQPLGTMIADVCTGAADIAGFVTRKRNLELAALYTMIRESGCYAVAVDGASIAEEKLRFREAEMIPVIVAASPLLASQTAHYVRSLRSA